MTDFKEVTAAQVAAAQLRQEAARLLRIAEALEATAPRQPRRRPKSISILDLSKRAL